MTIGRGEVHRDVGERDELARLYTNSWAADGPREGEKRRKPTTTSERRNCRSAARLLTGPAPVQAVPQSPAYKPTRHQHRLELGKPNDTTLIVCRCIASLRGLPRPSRDRCPTCVRSASEQRTYLAGCWA